MKYLPTSRLFFYFLFFYNLTYCQELPPIVKFSTNQYGAGNQNWMIAQNKDNFMYFANNDGLLEFNGGNWRLFKSPNEAIIRSVKIANNLIYTGSYMDFGFWSKTNTGHLTYKSISAAINSKLLDDEQFWNIHVYDQWIVFQSLNRLYIYDSITKKIKIISPKSGILKSFRTKNGIFFQTNTEGLFEIENGYSKLISNDLLFKSSKIVSIISNNNGLVIQTQQNGLFYFSNNVVKQFKTFIDSDLKNASVYSCLQLRNGDFAVGTVSNGLFIIDPNGFQKYHINQNKGLTNNTVLSLFEDNDQNLWIGLDNGINCINMQSPIKSYTDESGALGTVYTSKVFDNKLYIGTNQGLFYKDLKSNNDFRVIKGTKGQVWTLFDFQGTLFCGHDSGTYIVRKDVAQNIYANAGTWRFRSLPGRNDLLLQGNYQGISVLSKINGQWVYRNKIQGFDYSSKYFEIVRSNIFVSHEYKGVFCFDIDSEFNTASNVISFKSPIKGKNAGLIKHNNKVLYANANGIFAFDSKNKVFRKDIDLSSIFDNQNYSSGQMNVDENNKLWIFSKNAIYFFEQNKLSASLKKNIIPISSLISNSMSGYENINLLSNAEYLVGTTDGFYTVNTNFKNEKKFDVKISSIECGATDQEVKAIDLISNGEFNFDQNSLIFGFCVAEYDKYLSTDYQFLLDGFQNKWSRWSSKTSAVFKNLPSGSYTFIVRARVAGRISEQVAKYAFVIGKPWYKTNIMKVLYLLLVLCAAFYINKAYEKYYYDQKQKLIDENNRLLEFTALENEKQLMKIRNEELSNDVNVKVKELAVSTMSLIKKDELLAFIKEDLKKSDSENSNRSIKSVISTITKNINQDDSWNTFKEAFDSADKDFLKKIKTIHSTLTPNDLRLCAYLRLNLSSKEIAPLLNISVRSVEIKRYRLRKKMELTHEQGLVDYIFSL